MIKLFVTGDNHIGKKYDRYPTIKDKLINSRMDSLENMVDEAEKMGCGIFAVTGDLFDNVNNIKVSDVKKVVNILSKFTGTVLVLPGNHDYYTGEEKVWNDFRKAMGDKDNNIVILDDFVPYDLEVGDEKVTIYPAFCQSKHSISNNLDWIKAASVDMVGTYNIGMAHGTIKGLTPDLKDEYFVMREDELMSIPMDAWLIGHTHTQYPVLKDDVETEGYKIFNPGTHQQTDLNNNTEGVCFVITLDKVDGIATTKARKVISGQIRYYDLEIVVKPENDMALHNSIESLVAKLDKNSIVRIKVSGSVKDTEYVNKGSIYNKLLKDFLFYEIEDEALSEEISIDKIRTEYSELSFAAQFMESLLGDPVELKMAYELMKNCNE